MADLFELLLLNSPGTQAARPEHTLTPDVIKIAVNPTSATGAKNGMWAVILLGF